MNTKTRGQRRHRVTLSGPGPSVPDGDGGWTQPQVPLTPAVWYCDLRPANAREMERLTVATTGTHATTIATGDYHPGITTGTQLAFNGRTLFVNGVLSPEERQIETIALCEERVEGAA